MGTYVWGGEAPKNGVAAAVAAAFAAVPEWKPRAVGTNLAAFLLHYMS